MPKSPSKVPELEEKLKPDNKPAVRVDSAVAAITDLAFFSPTVRMHKIKIKFWSKFKTGPFGVSPDDLTALDVARVTGSASIEKWWKQSGFKEWFFNQEDQQERIQVLFEMGMSSMEELFLDEKVPASAKVAAFKAVAELGNKFPSKDMTVFADRQIEQMDAKQIEEFLKREGVKVVQENILDITQETNDEEE